MEPSLAYHLASVFPSVCYDLAWEVPEFGKAENPLYRPIEFGQIIHRLLVLNGGGELCACQGIAARGRVSGVDGCCKEKGNDSDQSPVHVERPSHLTVLTSKHDGRAGSVMRISCGKGMMEPITHLTGRHAFPASLETGDGLHDLVIGQVFDLRIPFKRLTCQTMDVANRTILRPVKMQQLLQSQQSPDLHSDFLGVRQWSVGMGEMQGEARIAAHGIEQLDTQGIALVRLAGYAFTVRKIEACG